MMIMSYATSWTVNPLSLTVHPLLVASRSAMLKSVIRLTVGCSTMCLNGAGKTTQGHPTKKLNQAQLLLQDVTLRCRLRLNQVVLSLWNSLPSHIKETLTLN